MATRKRVTKKGKPELSKAAENSAPAAKKRVRGRPFKKGQSGNPAGRTKGSKNKVTKTVKEALLTAFDLEGGVEYMQKLAREEPKAFASLLNKCIPQEIHAEIRDHVVQIFDYTGKSPHGVRREEPAE